MNISFYKIFDDKKVVNKKTDSTTLIKTISGSFKQDCDVMAPVVEVAYDNDLMTANYMYIPDLRRYYYVAPPVLSTQRLIFKGEVDVLKSYDAGIRALTCVVERQEYKHQLYLADKYFKALSYKVVKTFKWPRRFDKDHSSFVLTTGGKS